MKSFVCLFLLFYKTKQNKIVSCDFDVGNYIYTPEDKAVYWYSDSCT